MMNLKFINEDDVFSATEYLLCSFSHFVYNCILLLRLILTFSSVLIGLFLQRLLKIKLSTGSFKEPFGVDYARFLQPRYHSVTILC